MTGDKKITILVFPCGSEIGLEVYRSLSFSRNIDLIGGSSVDDHGRFVYENYIGDIPYYNDENFIPYLEELITRYKIDVIYPATDAVITATKERGALLNCIVIGPSAETAKICSSKKQTYEILDGIIPVPKMYNSIDEIVSYPIFLKPDIGYGSRGVNKAINKTEAEFYLQKNKECLLLEYLPGKEYTIDCFTDKDRKLLFAGPRVRNRIMNGISVNSSPVSEERFQLLAEKLNEKIVFRGAWFFQVKENNSGELVLMEIAGRLGGTSGIYRCKGINFALLSVFDAFGEVVRVDSNDFDIEIDRALESRYRLNIDFNTVYVDFDDTLIIKDKVNTKLVMLLYQFINEGKKLVLLTKHIYDINESLEKYKLRSIFDEVVLLKKENEKINFIEPAAAIFIDDSFSERNKVQQKFNIPVFAPDAIESLFKY